MDPNKFLRMCRLCKDKNSLLVNLIPSKSVKAKHSPGNILETIERFTTVKINPTDNLPQKICESCIQMINSMVRFRSKCIQTNDELHQLAGKVKESIDVIEVLENDDTRDTDNVGYDETEFLFEPDDDNDGMVNGTAEQNVESDRESENDSEQFEVKHSRPEKIACHICGKLYNANDLKYHMNEHDGLKPFHCKEPNCTATFSGPRYLSKHKRFCHTLKPQFFCDVCGRGFKSKVNLAMHRSYHFDPKLPCNICDKLLRNKRSLNKHMLVHSQERKFKCETCDKAFQTRYTLRIHKRVHTQEKPYSCDCGVSFAYKCLLKTHLLKVHSPVDK